MEFYYKIRSYNISQRKYSNALTEIHWFINWCREFKKLPVKFESVLPVSVIINGGNVKIFNLPEKIEQLPTSYEVKTQDEISTTVVLICYMILKRRFNKNFNLSTDGYQSKDFYNGKLKDIYQIFVEYMKFTGAKKVWSMAKFFEYLY